VLTVSGGVPNWVASSTLNYWQRNNGTLAPLNITDDFLLGATATTSAKFALYNVASGTPTASVSAGTNGATYLTADGNLATTALQTLTLGGSTTGTISLSPNGGTNKVSSLGTLTLASGKTYQINGTDVLSATALGSGVTSSSLTTVGALASGSIASGFGTIATANTITGTTLNGTTGINTGATAGTQRIDASGNLVNIGTTQFNTLTYTWPSSGQVNGYALTTNGSGTLSWADPVTLGSNWNLSAGALSPKQASVTDLLLGSNATASAKFAFKNVLTGTPTASISAGTNGAVYLDATGTLATTANQALTLGATTTGGINIGTDATARTINIGNATGATGVNIDTGTTGINLGDNANAKTIDIGGVTNSGTDTINIATNGTAADTLSFGNSNASTTFALTGGDDWSISAAGVGLFDDGLVGTAGIGFAADPDTGLYRISSNTLGLTAGGTQVQSLAAATSTFTSTVTTGTTTTSGFNFAANSLSSGTGFYMGSTSTSFSSGTLSEVNWLPGSATTATGDLFKITLGANGNIGNLFNVYDAGASASLFNISETQITSALPHQFTAASP
jgi:hypothetical protein